MKSTKMSLHNLGIYVFMLDLMDYRTNIYTTLQLTSKLLVSTMINNVDVTLVNNIIQIHKSVMRD